MLPHDMLMYASDVFWPCDRQRYMEEFVYPRLAIFEAAATLACGVADPGSHERVLLRRAVFHDNALKHWQIATRGRAQQQHRMKIALDPFAASQGARRLLKECVLRPSTSPSRQ